MELHVWGTPEKLSIIDAECLAIIWYMALIVPPENFQIITSSNTDISKSGKLPTLRVGEKTQEQYDGFFDIIRYLSEQGYDLDEPLSKEHRALNHGLLLYIQDKFQIVTDYTLFLNKSNYESYTRSIFKDYLPFPMQYNTPLQYRSIAKKNCSRIGLSVEDKTEVEQEMLKNVPTVSKVQQMKHESMIESKLVLKNSVSHMTCLNYFHNLIDTIINMQKELGNEEKINIFGDDITTADLLLLAHLYIQTHQSLPDQFITNYLLKLSQGFLETKTSNLKQIETEMSKVKINPPSFKDSPNLLNSIKHLLF